MELSCVLIKRVLTNNMGTKHHYWILLVLLLMACGDDDQPTPSSPLLPTFEDRPEDISIITSDIDLFWQTLDAANGNFENDHFLTNYFRGGSNELSLFYDSKIKDPQRLTEKLRIAAYLEYYNAIRENTLALADDQKSITDALQSFESSYPAAVYSDVVIVIGALGTGGTVVSNGAMVIGSEFFSKDANTSTDGLAPWIQNVTRELAYLPSIVIHELVHVQQRNFAQNQGLSGTGTLLEVALAEGIADFVTYTVLGIYFNDHLPVYADPLEEQLWMEFQTEMNNTDLSNWLFNGGSSVGRPGDLGYYIGFKIAEHFFDNQPNQTEALAQLMEIRDAQEFLELSGYATKFD